VTEAVEAREAVAEEMRTRREARSHEPAAETMETAAETTAAETTAVETTTVETTTVEAAHAGFSGRGRSQCSQEDDTCQCYCSPMRHSLLHLKGMSSSQLCAGFASASPALPQPTR